MPEFVTLKLGETKSGNAKTLHAYRSTANYYGWPESFPLWIGEPASTQGGRTYLFQPSRRGHPQCSSGRRIRICRSPSKNGFPAGFTNAFKVSSNVGLFDLAELAHFTKVNWEWMQDLTGNRINRSDWERRYARTTH